MVIVGLMVFCGQGGVKGIKSLIIEMDSIVYVVGNFLVSQFIELGLDVNVEQIGQGLVDVNVDNSYLIVEEVMSKMQMFQMSL